MGQTVSCAMSDESTDYSNISPLSNELESFITKQYKKQRRFVSCRHNNITVFNEESLTVMTYNILADGKRYALNSRYKYCNMKYRTFDYRGPRILLKFKTYEPDIICMQEITYKLYNEYFKLEMQKLGYIGIYGRRNNLHDNQQDDCIWIKTDKINVIKYKVIRLGNAPGKTSNSENNCVNDLICDTAEIRDLGRNKKTCQFYKQLENCKDVFIVALCSLKSSNQQFIVCSTHLYWKSKCPHIKVGQSYLFNYRLHKLLTKVWKIKDINKIPIVMGLDSNSLPKTSAMYAFMTKGTLSKSHAEHPANKYKISSIPNNDWKLPFDWTWKSVYKYNNDEPYLTKCIPHFHGCIDYLFVNNHFKVVKYVEMPWQSNLDYHFKNTSINVRVLDKNEIKNQKEIEKQFAMHFNECPNEWYPSDHLMLCAKLVFDKVK